MYRDNGKENRSYYLGFKDKANTMSPEHEPIGVHSLGFRGYGLGFRVQGLGFRVRGLQGVMKVKVKDLKLQKLNLVPSSAF